jgi:hypothetical protein
MAFDGTYNATINTPMGKQQGTLKLSSSSSELTGTMEQGGDKVDIKNGKVDGDKASWDVDVSKPMPLTLSFDGTDHGDKITGNVKLGAFGNSTFEAVKA